jgi:hypothetical protein
MATLIMEYRFLSAVILFATTFFESSVIADVIFEANRSDGATLIVSSSPILGRPAGPPYPEGTFVEGENITFRLRSADRKTETVLWTQDHGHIGLPADRVDKFEVLAASVQNDVLTFVYRARPMVIGQIITQTKEGPKKQLSFAGSTLMREIDAGGLHCKSASISGATTKSLVITLDLADKGTQKYELAEDARGWKAATSKEPPATRPGGGKGSG